MSLLQWKIFFHGPAPRWDQPTELWHPHFTQVSKDSKCYNKDERPISVRGSEEQASWLADTSQVRPESIWLLCPQASASANANEIFCKQCFQNEQHKQNCESIFQRTEATDKEWYVFIQLSLFHRSRWNPVCLVTICLHFLSRHAIPSHSSDNSNAPGAGWPQPRIRCKKFPRLQLTHSDNCTQQKQGRLLGQISILSCFFFFPIFYIPAWNRMVSSKL